MSSRTKNLLEIVPQKVLTLMKETNKAYPSEELALHFGISDGSCKDILYYMKETGMIASRNFKVNFYYLKDKYTIQEIKKKVERAYNKKYDLKTTRPPV